MYSGAFCPIKERGSGIGDWIDGGGLVLNKDKGPTPLERLSKFHPPGPATLNSTWTVSHEKQATRENQGSTLPPNAGPLARDEPQTTAGKDGGNYERYHPLGGGASPCRRHCNPATNTRR